MEILLIGLYCFLYLIPSLILERMQYSHIKQAIHHKAVILPQKDYVIAGEYALKKLRVAFIRHLVELGAFIFWVSVGIEWINHLVFQGNFGFGTNLSCVLIVLSFLLLSQLFALPISYYTAMILDKKYGFSTQGNGVFFLDLLKSNVLMLVAGGAVLYLLTFTIHNLRMWWFVGALLICFVVVLANFIYPTLIAPIFNTFTPLNDCALKGRIEELMQKVGFQSSGIFVVDASKRDGRLNAYFGGFGKSKRVVLFDTLLDKVSNDGLIAILGHELWHFKHKDILFNTLLISLFIFTIFFIVGQLPYEIFSGLGVDKNAGNLIVVLILLSPLLSFLFLPIMGYFSRKAEYRADEFGSSLSSKRSLAEALVRLVNENKTFPSSHPAYIFFYYTHPPLLQRLKALDYEP